MCRYLPGFLDKGKWEPTTALERLVLGTLARGRGTFATLLDLVEADCALQAAMLGRPLFEDMIVAHWLVLHQADPEWLIQRFGRHADAMRLQEARVRKEVNWPPSGDDVSDLIEREEALRAEFGPHAERDWWGQDASGKRIGMPEVVRRLAAAGRFHPRLKGEQPILEQYYAIQQKDWTQSLHHTAAGLNLRPGEPGAIPDVLPTPRSFTILFANYWVFGQLIFVALELGAPAAVVDHFEELFFAGLAVFGEWIGEPAPWADDFDGWVRDTRSK